jgi:hypothetical protein
MQRLVEVVHGGSLVPVRPQRGQEDVAVQPLVTRERQEFDERPRFAEPPRPGRDGLTSAFHHEPTEQPDLQNHHLIERSYLDLTKMARYMP